MSLWRTDHDAEQRQQMWWLFALAIAFLLYKSQQVSASLVRGVVNRNIASASSRLRAQTRAARAATRAREALLVQVARTAAAASTQPHIQGWLNSMAATLPPEQHAILTRLFQPRDDIAALVARVNAISDQAKALAISAQASGTWRSQLGGLLNIVMIVISSLAAIFTGGVSSAVVYGTLVIDVSWLDVLCNPFVLTLSNLLLQSLQSYLQLDATGAAFQSYAFQLVSLAQGIDEDIAVVDTMTLSDLQTLLSDSEHQLNDLQTQALLSISN